LASGHGLHQAPGPGWFSARAPRPCWPSLAYREPVFRETLRYSVQGLALVGIILPLVAAPRVGALVKILEIAPLRWMGRRSYAAYLWHMLALSLGSLIVGYGGIIENAPRSTQLQALPFVVALSWIFAELSYRFVYTPAQRLKPLVTPAEEDRQRTRPPSPGTKPPRRSANATTGKPPATLARSLLALLTSRSNAADEERHDDGDHRRRDSDPAALSTAFRPPEHQFR
jgi:hypothetical protein